jgi:uncharacterized membrane protein YedE/YeeE
MRLCGYRNVFGPARTGVHAWRLPMVDLAVVDLALTLIASVIVGFAIHYHRITASDDEYRLIFKHSLVCFLVLWVMGTGLHAMFCVPTPVLSFFTPPLPTGEE